MKFIVIAIFIWIFFFHLDPPWKKSSDEVPLQDLDLYFCTLVYGRLGFDFTKMMNDGK